MPLLINDETVVWQETLDVMHIKLPLPDRYLKAASIITTSLFIKVSSLPYYWECFLHRAVDSDKSIARVGDSAVTFELTKCKKQLWNCLKHSNSNDKNYCREQRKLAMSEHENNINSVIQKKAAIKYEVGKCAIREQMLIDELERKRIADTKAVERQKLNTELKKFWQNEENEPKTKVKSPSKQKNNKDSKVSEKKLVVRNVPLPRQNSKITVDFTPRVFPTAARESQENEEQIWLSKQTEARKSLDFDCSDLAPIEKNPMWLQDKGNKFSKNGDYLAAVNAYNLAIRMCSNVHSLYSNRAFCHLQLKNLHKVLEDSSKALELLMPYVDSNAGERAINYAYRAKAFSGLGLYVEALMDVDAALSLNPNNQDLKNEAQDLRQLIQRNS